MTQANQITSTTGSESNNAIAGKKNYKNAIREIRVLGNPHFYGSPLGAASGADVEFQLIADAGWILITSGGNENLYFKFKTDAGEELTGYCKCL